MNVPFQPLSFALAIMLLSSAGAVGQPVPDAAAETTPVSGQMIDIDFAGGSVAEFVTALREALPQINIVLRSRVDEFQVVPIRLRNAHELAAVTLLETVATHPLQPDARLGVKSVQGPSGLQQVSPGIMSERRPLGNTVYVLAPVNLTPREVEAPPPARSYSRIFSLTNVLVELGAADILTAVELALELMGDAYEEPQLRFHEETGLLIARGHVAQMSEIDAVVKQLELAADQRRIHDHQQQRAQAVQSLALQKELDAAREEAKRANGELVRMATRMEIIEAEMHSALRRLEAEQTKTTELERRLREATAGRPAPPQ